MSVLNFQCEHRFPSGFELNVAFELEHRFTALFGPSGSGKTTILSMIAGFLRPESGRIELAGQTVFDAANGICLPPERRAIGFVFQDALLFPHLNVEANLRYGASRRGGSSKEVTFGRVAEVLEISHLLHRYPRNLSGGERQRVALGRALLSGPELLLMDEPLASLDVELKLRVLAYVKRIVDEWDVPTLFVTHAQADVRRATDWIVMIDNGRLVACGSAEEALSRPEALGLGDSAGPVNLLRIEELSTTDGELAGRVGQQWLRLPPASDQTREPAFIQFSPTNVVLSRHDVTGVSARNHLHGHVLKIVEVDRADFVAIDIGQVLWAEVTPQAVTELQLEPGAEVTCLLKTHSLSVLEQ